MTVKNNNGKTPLEKAPSAKQQSMSLHLFLNTQRDKYQKQHDVTDYLRDAKESIMVEMKVFEAEVAECV